MCAAVAAAFIVGEEPFTESRSEETGAMTKVYLGHGVPHDQYGSMLSGGPGADRHSNIFWAGLAFAALQAVFFVALLAFGIRKKEKVGPALVPILVGGAGYVAIVTLLFLSYRAYMNDAAPELVFALPKPTAWMIYGIWMFPICFVFVFRYFFNSWYLTDEDMERYNAIVADRRQAEEESA